MSRAPARFRHDAWLVTAVALAARLAVVLWAAPRIPPAADGTYYQRIARAHRGQGLGYTWLWPDGAVTYAAHYPVGYPARSAPCTRSSVLTPRAAMALNALLGALAAFRRTARSPRASRREARAAPRRPRSSRCTPAWSPTRRP
jgi:hypothetical protein